MEKRIAELFSQFDSTLTSITGIGPVLGSVILSEVRDISCFASADKLAAYAGLNPKMKQSGDMKSSAVHMSKCGSPYLRRAVWMASAVAVQYDPMFKAYYKKKAAEGLRYMNIIGHVTKKMVASSSRSCGTTSYTNRSCLPLSSPLSIQLIWPTAVGLLTCTLFSSALFKTF